MHGGGFVSSDDDGLNAGHVATDGALDRVDAGIFLQVLQIYLSPPVVEARRFWGTVPDGLGLEQLNASYPLGSEGRSHIWTVLLFWESIGGLLKRGLLREELAFDTVLDVPPWQKVENLVRDMRVERNDPAEGENLEYAYRRAMAYAADRRS
jgi:hypothetical protein